MANPEHETILRAGVECWNQWRTTYPGAPDLRAAVFENLDLRGVNLSHANLQEVAFRGCQFTSANFESAELQCAEFSGISLAEHVVFSRAKMDGIKFIRCIWKYTLFIDVYLTNARLEEGRFLDCDFSSASLIKVHCLDCMMSGCIFREANLSGCRFEPAEFGTPVQANTMYRCVFTNADLTGADLRGVVGYQFDHNNIQGTVITPRALDDWSVLRRTYTGSRFIFNLIFLLFFFAPVVAKTVFWMEVSRLEAHLPEMLSTLNQLSDKLEMTSGQVGRDMAGALRRATGDVPILRKGAGGPSGFALDQLLPFWLAARLTMDPGAAGRLLGSALEGSLAGSAPVKNTRQLLDHLIDQLDRRPENEARAMADALRRSTATLPSRLPRPSNLVISVILGLDVPWKQAGISGALGAGAGILLIAYNAARGLLTFFVSRLRDEEQITAHTPRRGWWRQSVRQPPAAPSNWARLKASMWSRWETVRHLPDKFREDYAWMIGPQRIVSWLQYLAYGMSAIHLYTLVTGTVVLPN